MRASGEVVPKAQTGRFNKRVASRRKFREGNSTEQNEPMSGELLERLWLKHEPVGSVNELQVGARLGEVTEPNKMSL